MDKFEYKVIPAPTKAKRGKWVRGVATRFADRLEQIFNEMGADGWEYVRTDTLPHEERKGLTQTTVTYRNLLVFRKLIPAVTPEFSTTIAVEDKSPTPIALLESPTQFRAANDQGVDLETDEQTDLGMEIIRQQRLQAEKLRQQPLVLTDALTEDAEIVEHEFLDDDPAISDSLVQAILSGNDDLTQANLNDDLHVHEASESGHTGPINVALAARIQNTDDKT